MSGSVEWATSRTIRRYGAVVKAKTQDVVVALRRLPLDVVVWPISCSSTLRAGLSTLGEGSSTRLWCLLHGSWRGCAQGTNTNRCSVQSRSPFRAIGPVGAPRLGPGGRPAGHGQGPTAASAEFPPGDRYGRSLAETWQDSHQEIVATSNRPESGRRASSVGHKSLWVKVLPGRVPGTDECSAR